MKRKNPQGMSVDELIHRFADIGMAQDGALLGNEIAKFTRLYHEMAAVVQELRGREGDQRTALLALYDHPNMQVRLKAAKNTLAVAPAAARQAIEEIKRSKWFPQAGEAGMTLDFLDDGTFKPT